MVMEVSGDYSQSDSTQVSTLAVCIDCLSTNENTENLAKIGLQSVQMLYVVLIEM